VSKPIMIRLTVRIRKSTHKRVKSCAKKDGMTMQEVVENALSEYC
jgi:predicted HicB family RNase H-like nuclease